MWNLKFRKRITQAQLGLSDDDLPTVDIMIPCYSEPTEIVEMTLKVCVRERDGGVQRCVCESG